MSLIRTEITRDNGDPCVVQSECYGPREWEWPTPVDESITLSAGEQSDADLAIAAARAGALRGREGTALADAH